MIAAGLAEVARGLAIYGIVGDSATASAESISRASLEMIEQGLDQAAKAVKAAGQGTRE